MNTLERVTVVIMGSLSVGGLASSDRWGVVAVVVVTRIFVRPDFAGIFKLLLLETRAVVHFAEQLSAGRLPRGLWPYLFVTLGRLWGISVSTTPNRFRWGARQTFLRRQVCSGVSRRWVRL